MNLLQLPEDIIMLILDFVRVRGMIRASMTCTKLKKVFKTKLRQSLDLKDDLRWAKLKRGHVPKNSMKEIYGSCYLFHELQYEGRIIIAKRVQIECDGYRTRAEILELLSNKGEVIQSLDINRKRNAWVSAIASNRKHVTLCLNNNTILYWDIEGELADINRILNEDEDDESTETVVTRHANLKLSTTSCYLAVPSSNDEPEIYWISAENKKGCLMRYKKTGEETIIETIHITDADLEEISCCDDLLFIVTKNPNQIIVWSRSQRKSLSYLEHTDILNISSRILNGVTMLFGTVSERLNIYSFDYDTMDLHLLHQVGNCNTIFNDGRYSFDYDTMDLHLYQVGNCVTFFDDAAAITPTSIVCIGSLRRKHEIHSFYYFHNYEIRVWKIFAQSSKKSTRLFLLQVLDLAILRNLIDDEIINSVEFFPDGRIAIIGGCKTVIVDKEW